MIWIKFSGEASVRVDVCLSTNRISTVRGSWYSSCSVKLDKFEIVRAAWRKIFWKNSIISGSLYVKLHAVNRVNQRQRKTCVQYRTETTVLISSTKSNIQLHCDIITNNRDSFDALVYSQIHYISARRIFVPKRFLVITIST